MTTLWLYCQKCARWKTFTAVDTPTTIGVDTTSHDEWKCECGKVAHRHVVLYDFKHARERILGGGHNA